VADSRTVEFNFIGQAAKLIQTLESIEKHIRQVPKDKTVNIKAKTTAARKDITEIQLELRKLAATETNPEVKLKLTRLLADIARARAMIATIPENKTLTINMRESVFSKLANSGRLAETAVNGIETALKGVGDATRTAEGPLSAFGDTAGKASGTLRRLGPLLAGISIVLTTALAPALIALGAAFAGAVAGAGALAAALGTVLVPAALSLVGILGRVSEITKVFALRQAATQAATRATASAAQRAAAAEDSLRNARRSLNDATTSVTRAEEDLNTARANARDDIVDAQKRLTDAQENQSEASRDLGRVTVQAYREIRDAIEEKYG